MKVKALDIKLQKLVINQYKKGISVNEIAKNELIPFSSPHSIIKVLKMNNITIRSKAGFKPDFNEDYFEKIDKEGKAYFLGLIITDGSVYLRKNSQPCISIELQNEDVHILHTFKKELNVINKVEKSRVRANGRIHCKFRLHSSKMVDDLTKYGVVPNKTQFTFLPKLESHFMPHLIRGLLDGDGWIQSIGIKKGCKRRVGFCSASEIFIIQLRDFLNQSLGLPLLKIQKRKKTNCFLFQLLYCGEQDVKKLLDYLYQDATIYLKRKYERARVFIQK